ncbi:ATPase family associated with various cellular activities (AAA) [Xylanibacter ruminicola]|uniref:ATPase family associated with various cellular activities (AAA) n=1 Tax=Xylanibacter ruminicola TaxID=839 RepID=A0A1M7JPB9_XYLRU|nr:ATP-binding protein [Xylanibacter ruminicola]SFC46467.1 ATPase family associated with various cellular activities (AAA) [Xylanibacter ruminicola]SHM54940.1 ATPase family associated with various cellular activities (AAA) [Xylanibacter ruminicola]
MPPRRLKIQKRSTNLDFDMRPERSLFDNEEKEYKEPDTWTIITAMNRVLDQARGSELTDEFWESIKNPLAFLRGELGINDIQIVVLAMLIEAGEPLSWKKMGNYLNCSRLQMMTYTDEIEEMVRKRWFVRRGTHEIGGFFEGFALARGLITALRHNQVFVPEKIDGLTEQQFVDKLESHISKGLNDRHTEFRDDEEWMVELCKANPHLPLCHEVLRFDDIHVQSLLLMIVFDYAQWEGSDGEGLTMETISDLYPEDFDCNFLRQNLREGIHPLIQAGYIEYKCRDGMADNEQYKLTLRAKQELLSAYKPSHSKCRRYQNSYNRMLKSHDTIKAKELFFNDSEQQQIERLTSLLSIDNFPSIQQRLEEQGMRKGFACLFYGGPGTGKTETVLQIARQTGRNLMQVDIAGMRDKFVGESEKNIKAVFARYREICQNSEVQPILFFNEADALINKRTENIEHSVDKMDNAMQNIILQEIEDLDGILIATTNLTSNLDSAFERRFLYKVEFHKPDTTVKSKIWRSMLKDLSDDDAQQLASHFDFSGGQIENIARKRTVDYILSGQYATLEQLEDYCRAEQLANNKSRHRIAGFSLSGDRFLAGTDKHQ